MVVSLLIAIALWAFVIGTMDPTVKKTYSDVNVSFTGEAALNDAGLAIAKSSISTISVTISGKKSVVNDMEASDILATIDVRNLALGENKCAIKTKAENGCKVVSQEYTFAYVTVEKVEEATRDIVVNFAGTKDNGQEATATWQSKDTVKIMGAETLVKRVTRVNAVVDAKKVKSTEGTFEARLEAVDKNNKPVKNIICSEKTIKVKAVLYKTKKVPLEIEVKGVSSGKISKTIRKPDSVTIKGPSDKLDKIDSLRAEPINVASVNKTTEIPIKLSLPKGVYVAESSKPLVVKVDAGETVSKTFEVSTEQIKVSTNKSYRIEQDTVSITVTGNKEIISKLVKSDFKLSAELSDRDSEGEAEVKCHKIDGVNIIINPSRINVIVNE